MATKKKAGKGKTGSKPKRKKAIQVERVEEVQNLVTSAPPAPEPQALPSGEVTDPQAQS